MVYSSATVCRCKLFFKEEERRLRDEHIAFQQQELESEQQRQQELLKKEEAIKKRVAQDLKGWSQAQTHAEFICITNKHMDL